MIITVVIVIVTVIIVVTVVAMCARRDTVIVLQPADREANQAAIEMVAGAQRQGAGAATGVVDIPVGSVKLVVVIVVIVGMVVVLIVIVVLTGSQAGNIEVIPIPVERVDMQREVAAAGIEPQHAGVHIRGRIVTHFGAALDTVKPLPRDPVVDNVYHPANGAGAVEHGGGAAQNLDAVRQQGFHRDCVVGADGRGIGAAGAILQHSDPRALLAADHRLAYARAEGCIGQAGNIAQGIANIRASGAAQGFTGQHGHRQGGFRFLLVQRRGYQYMFNRQRLRRHVRTGNRQRERHKTSHGLLLIEKRKKLLFRSSRGDLSFGGGGSDCGRGLPAGPAAAVPPAGGARGEAAHLPAAGARRSCTADIVLIRHQARGHGSPPGPAHL